MARLPQNIITFANGNKDVEKIYEQMKDYYCHYSMSVDGKQIGDYDATISLAEKEEKMYSAFLSEIERISGTKKPQEMSYELWSTNPAVKWATFAVAGMMIDAVIPDTIIKTTGVYASYETVGFGETLDIDIEPNSLFTVSESSNAQRKGFNKKQFDTTISLSAVNHQITVEVAMYKVLSGKESLAKFVRKAVASMERAMTVDAYGKIVALVSGANLSSNLKATGYTVEALLTLCQKVEAYNNGARPTIVGTAKAIYKVLPDVAKGYRINTDASNPTISLVKNFFDYDIMVLPQVATGKGYGLALDDDKLFVISTGAEKIVRGIIEGQTLTNIDNFYDNADLTQHATLNKRWNTVVATNATMACMTLQ